jgi:hypothetical protein
MLPPSTGRMRTEAAIFPQDSSVLEMGAAGFSKMFVPFYQTTQHHITED